MAEVGDKPLDESEKEITCAVCQGHYQQAKLLPCNHYYCETCIEKLAKNSRGKPFDCPECLKETSLPDGGAGELQGAFFVERMKDVYGKMGKAEGKIEALCEQCAGAKSVAYCRQCEEFICRECVRCHNKMKAFSLHIVASLEDLKKGGIESIPLKEAPPTKCPVHDLGIKMFCFDCDQLICRDCTFIDHLGHNFDFLKKCAPESRKTLRENLAPLQSIQADIEGAKKMLESEQAKVESQRNEVCKSLEEAFEKLKCLLDQRKMELVKSATTLAQEKKEALTTQKKGFRVAQTEIQLLVEFAERNIENTSDQDLMSICTQLQTKLDEEEKRHRQLSLEPTGSVDISCTLPSPGAIPNNLGSIFIQPTPALLHYIELCELGSQLDVLVVAPTVSLEDISASLKCVVNPSSSSLKGDIVQKGVGIYSITLTPEVRGRHDLTVTVKNEEISGSPFRVFVKISPMQLGQHVRKIGGFDRPWGITINNKQQLVVAESYGNGKEKVTIMERDGKKVQTINCAQFRDPRGVATGPDGAIYVTDVDAHCLFKFDTGGTLLKTVDNELQKPYSVKIIQNQLYVVDYANCLVKIFDMDCNVVGTIPTKECPKPGDIAEGPDGLYVACRKKISVYHCAPNGTFIRHLDIQPSSLKFSEFNGICFDRSGHIIASDLDNGVYIFKPSGECVRLVGSDVVRGPAGVTVDEDGFVYVCGFWSHNVVL